MIRSGHSSIGVALALLALGIGLCGCAQGRPFALPDRKQEPLTGDGVIIESVDGAAVYRVQDAARILPLLEQLPLAGSLKESESLRVWVLENDTIVYRASAYERTQYVDWGEEVPEGLLATIERSMNDENRVYAYRFLAYEPKRHDERMAALRAAYGARVFCALQGGRTGGLLSQPAPVLQLL